MPKLLREDGPHGRPKWVFIGTYDERHIPKTAHFVWDPGIRRWWTDNIDFAASLADYADEAVKSDLCRADKSRALTSDFNPPSPPGCAYMPFQRAGIEYCLSTRSGNALIGDEMGLGKSIEALGVINCLPDLHTVLIVCPASVRGHWAREAAKWLIRPHLIHVWHAPDKITPTYGPDLQVHIINWELISRRLDTLLALAPDILVADEVHYAKTPKAARTKAFTALVKEAKRALALSGTPIKNRPIELWPVIHALDPQGWPNWFWFVNRYCAGHEKVIGYDRLLHEKRTALDVRGASNLDQLQQQLRKTLMIRRRKVDVLTEMPPVRRAVIELDAAQYATELAAEQTVLSKSKASVRDLRARLEAVSDNHAATEYKQAALELSKGINAAFTDLSRVRHETALAKAPDVVAFCDEALAEDQVDKLLLFHHHHDVGVLLAEGLSKYGVVTLTGETPQGARQAVIDAFQTDEKVRVFCGSILAAGQGITLTAASTVVFAELDWVPANLCQAESRAHRIGQENAVMVYHLLVANSIDAEMARRVVEKQEIIDAALDDITSDLTLKPFEVLDIQPTRDEVFEFTHQERAAIHAALRKLSAESDPLNPTDTGFARAHAQIGHTLAIQEPFDSRACAVGVRVARLYAGRLEHNHGTLIEAAYQRWRASHEQHEHEGATR